MNSLLVRSSFPFHTRPLLLYIGHKSSQEATTHESLCIVVAGGEETYWGDQTEPPYRRPPQRR